MTRETWRPQRDSNPRRRDENPMLFSSYSLVHSLGCVDKSNSQRSVSCHRIPDSSAPFRGVAAQFAAQVDAAPAPTRLFAGTPLPSSRLAAAALQDKGPEFFRNPGPDDITRDHRPLLLFAGCLGDTAPTFVAAGGPSGFGRRGGPSRPVYRAALPTQGGAPRSGPHHRANPRSLEIDRDPLVSAVIPPYYQGMAINDTTPTASLPTVTADALEMDRVLSEILSRPTVPAPADFNPRFPSLADLAEQVGAL
jgi:hypothetical protein